MYVSRWKTTPFNKNNSAPKVGLLIACAASRFGVGSESSPIFFFFNRVKRKQHQSIFHNNFYAQIIRVIKWYAPSSNPFFLFDRIAHNVFVHFTINNHFMLIKQRRRNWGSALHPSMQTCCHIGCYYHNDDTPLGYIVITMYFPYIECIFLHLLLQLICILSIGKILQTLPCEIMVSSSWFKEDCACFVL